MQWRYAVAVLAAAAACGCSSTYGGATAAGSGTGISATTAGAAGVAAVLTLDYLAQGPGGRPPTIESRLLGESRANIGICAGGDREREVLADGRERWSYTEGDCQYTLEFDKGYVSAVRFATTADACRRALQRCLEP